MSNNDDGVRHELLMGLYTPARREADGTLSLEMSSAGGVALWLELFETVCVIVPLFPSADRVARDKVARHKAPLTTWRRVDSIPGHDRLTVVALPWAFASRFAAARHAGAARRTIREHVRRSRYVLATIGGFRGDWPGMVADEARRMHHPYAVTADRVEDEVVRREARSLPALRRISRELMARRMAAWHRRLITHADLVMCHGPTIYEAYSRLTPAAVSVYAGTLRDDDLMPPADVEAKAARLAASGPDAPRRIVYAGRTAEMKGPLDWVTTLARLRAPDAGGAALDFTACWYGDGPQQGALREALEAQGLSNIVEAPGFVDRGRILDDLSRADLFVFCHKTPESPRNVIEAMARAAPAVGYSDPYVREVTQAAGLLTPAHDPASLAAAITTLARDPGRLAAMARAARAQAERFTARPNFAERARLLREALGP